MPVSSPRIISFQHSASGSWTSVCWPMSWKIWLLAAGVINQGFSSEFLPLIFFLLSIVASPFIFLSFILFWSFEAPLVYKTVLGASHLATLRERQWVRETVSEFTPGTLLSSDLWWYWGLNVDLRASSMKDFCITAMRSLHHDFLFLTKIKLGRECTKT